MKKIFFSAISVVLVVIFIPVFGLGFANANKIAYGVTVAGIDVGGMEMGEARHLLESKSEKLFKEDVVLIVDGKKYSAKYEEIGLRFDFEKSLENAFATGRDGNFVENMFEQTGAVLEGKDVLLEARLNMEMADNYLKKFAYLEKEKRNAEIIFDDVAGDFKIQNSIVGKIIDRNQLEKDIAGLAGNLQSGEIAVSFREDVPETSDKEALGVLAQAKKTFIDSSTISLKYSGGNSSWPVDKKTIGGWIGVVGESGNWRADFLEERISDYLVQISQNINQEPVDAVLAYEKNKVSAFKLSRDGNYVNAKLSAIKILSALQSGQKDVDLEMNKIKAKIDTSEIENLGLTALLATGVSDFSGSPANRVHNIKTGAARFSGVLLAPGEEFSFVKILGEVGPAEGYLPELVIKKDKTVPEYGGGLCQISTTAFRAAVLAGLEIKERYPHSFPVKYYNPQGFDAAIYPPSPDLKFINDTPSNLLIQTKIKGGKAYFEFYGTDDGRKVVLTGPEEYDKKPDGSMKTKLTREIFDKDGNSIRKTVFRSSYKSPDLYPVVRNPLE